MSKSSCSQVGEKALVMDSFGTSFIFLLPDGNKSYKSLLGTILTVLIVLTMAFYGVYKWQILVDREEAVVTLNVEDGYWLDKNSTISQSNGFISCTIIVILIVASRWS